MTEYRVTWFVPGGAARNYTSRERSEVEKVYSEAEADKAFPIMESREVSPWDTVKQAIS